MRQLVKKTKGKDPQAESSKEEPNVETMVQGKHRAVRHKGTLQDP